MNEPNAQLLTVQQHILEEQRRLYPDASGEFSWLLSGITLATKIVAAQVRRAGLAGIVGVTRETNVQGEQVQKLEVVANETSSERRRGWERGVSRGVPK